MAKKQRGQPVISLRLEPQVRVALENIAQREGTTTSNLIREGIRMLVVRRISKYGSLADTERANKAIPGQLAAGLNGDVGEVVDDGREIAHAP